MGISIQDIVGGSLAEAVKGIIGCFKASPDKILEMQQMVEQNRAAFEQKEVDANTKLNDIAGQNIRAEAQSGDKFTSRARPSVIWMGNALLLWNYGIVPMVGLHWHLRPVDLPDAFWWTWGTVVTGYVFARTAQEASKTILGGAGGSAQLPFGIKLDSKGD